MSQLHELIEDLREKAGIRPTELSRQIGRSPSYYRKLMETKGTPSSETLARLARALGVEPNVLLSPSNEPDELPVVTPTPNAVSAEVQLPARNSMPRDVPVFGTASGSIAGAQEGAWQMTSDPVDWVRRPPGLISARDAYALYVENSSMEPRYPPGELIFIHPGRPPRTGDTVVVQIQHAEHAPIETYIKILVRRTNGDLICRQYNPEAEIRFTGTTVKSVHRVLSMADVVGA